ncbi:MAG: class I SAM-dependent methyltransferase [Bacteroidota bacterium]
MQIMLPGLGKQLEFFLKNYNAVPKKILVIGSASEYIAKSIAEQFNCRVDLIVEDYESLLNSKLLIGNNSDINIKLMEYDITDFQDSEFDLVYAQASISLTKRNKIIKELKRITKAGSYFCMGEIVNLTQPVPRFIKDIYDSTDLLPLHVESIEQYYSERGFSILASSDFSKSLRDYYRNTLNMLKNSKQHLTDSEKSYYKKLLNKISHESNAYLKLGGDKYTGFKVLLLQKGQN